MSSWHVHRRTISNTCGIGSACRLRNGPLVSRLFSEACRDPTMWPELHVLRSAFRTEARWQGFLRWLAVRASGLRILAFGEKGGMVRHLKPEAPRSF